MGLQHHQPTAAAAGGGDGDSRLHQPQRSKNPRYAGSMTRRAPSFKRVGGHGEIELQINSPRSTGESPVASPSSEPLPVLERDRWQQNPVRKRGAVLRERRRVRNWMLIVFCGVCLLLGVVKISVRRDSVEDYQLDSLGALPLAEKKRTEKENRNMKREVCRGSVLPHDPPVENLCSLTPWLGLFGGKKSTTTYKRKLGSRIGLYLLSLPTPSGKPLQFDFTNRLSYSLVIRTFNMDDDIVCSKLILLE